MRKAIRLTENLDFDAVHPKWAKQEPIMSSFEQQVVEVSNWVSSSRFKGIVRLHP